MRLSVRVTALVILSLSVTIPALPAAASSGAPPARYEFEGELVFSQELPVGLVAGTAEHPRLVEIESIRFEPTYGNAWAVTARVGWLPVVEASWKLKAELLDAQGHVLRHSRDEEAIFTGTIARASQTTMRYVDLDMDAMHDQGRRHAARFRVRLESLSQPPDAAPRGEAKPHVLEIVVQQEDGEPVPDASVVVQSTHITDRYRRHSMLYTTDAQGRCQIALDTNQPHFSLNVEVQKPDFASMAQSWSNDSSWPASRMPMTGLPERHVFDMIPASAAGGIVQDEDGNPIGGAEIQLSASLRDASGRVHVSRMVRSGANGRWRVEGVPAEVDRISLGFRHPEYASGHYASRTATGAALADIRAITHVETLAKGVELIGSVCDEQGRPIAQATALLSGRHSVLSHALTDSAGRFTLICLEDRDAYGPVPTVIVEAPGYAPAKKAFDLEPNPAPLTFQLARGRTITCHVVDRDGQPVVGAWPVVEPLGTEHSDYSVWLEDTDGQGAFVVPNVPAGEVSLTVGKLGFITTRSYAVGATQDEVTIPMQRALTVRGTVCDAETGKPIPSFEIAVLRDTGGQGRADRPMLFTGGDYALTFDETSQNTWQLHVSAVGYESADSKVFEIEEGRREFNFQLARASAFDEETAGRARPKATLPGARRIAGIVRDENGAPVPGAYVSMRPSLTLETVLTDSKGAFKLRRRGDSPYREESIHVVVRHRERNLAAALPLNEATDHFDIKLSSGAVFRGRVVDANGQGIPAAKMSLTMWISDTGYGRKEPTQTGPDGRFEIRAVPRGFVYSVQAEAEGYGTRYVRVNPADAVNDHLELEPLVLEESNLSTSGVVVDDLGRPVPHIRVYAYGNGQPTREVHTNSQGEFTLENVCKGTINIQANASEPQRLHGRARVEGGATDVRIVVYQRDARGRKVATQPAALIGKSLPDFEDIKVDFSSEQAEGKRLLICFWDMQQRPSRNCVVQLARKAQELAERNVVVVIVQASPVDADALDEWIKAQNAPFIVGMVKADSSTAVGIQAGSMRFNWNVRSLPWLILTSDKHVVIAEGFSLDALDETLR